MNILRRFGPRAAIILTVLLLTPPNIFSCGPLFTPLVFTRKEMPDPPLQPFVAGKLGIVQPGYRRQYLVVAYRYLAGRPLTRTEEANLIDAWSPKIIPPGQPWPDEVPVNRWLAARSTALGQKQVTKIEIPRFKPVGGGWERYPNCGDDAFTTAAETALSRTKIFGQGDSLMRDWVQAQDTVFQNCGEPPGKSDEPAVHIPSPAVLHNTVLRLDREYQVAAANFYAGNWDIAAEEFEHIAQDRDSPWRTWAPYVVARCFIRKATLVS